MKFLPIPYLAAKTTHDFVLEKSAAPAKFSFISMKKGFTCAFGAEFNATFNAAANLVFLAIVQAVQLAREARKRAGAVGDDFQTMVAAEFDGHVKTFALPLIDKAGFRAAPQAVWDVFEQMTKDASKLPKLVIGNNILRDIDTDNADTGILFPTTVVDARRVSLADAMASHEKNMVEEAKYPVLQECYSGFVGFPLRLWMQTDATDASGEEALKNIVFNASVRADAEYAAKAHDLPLYNYKASALSGNVMIPNDDFVPNVSNSDGVAAFEKFVREGLAAL